jgi:DNA-binding CsgD family transcriptional regulator
MSKVDSQVARWLDIVGDLLKVPRTVVPHAEICRELGQTFDVTTATWDWQDTFTHYGFEAFPVPKGLSDAFWVAQQNPDLRSQQPLLRWYTETLDPRPHTLGRVPRPIATSQGLAIADEVLKPIGCEQNLSIPYRLSGTGHRAFLLFRSGRDFDDDDIEIAHRLQGAFMALDTQAEVLARTGSGSPHSVVDGFGLTGRELSVLSLLADGYSAFGIARRLAISPRTVQKHLENAYRKLEVRDRLSAVQVAQAACLLPLPGSQPQTRPTSASA